MKLQKQYESLLILEKDIDKRLKNLNFETMKEMLLWLAKSENYQKIKVKDNKLNRLDFFCEIWLEEKKKLTAYQIKEDIFGGIDSLEKLEQKYLRLEFGILRLETPMPEEYYEQVIDYIIDYKISGIALCYMIMRETEKKEENIIKLAKLLHGRNQIITEIVLLQKALEFYSKNQFFLMELAECWMEGHQWEQALLCLKEIEEPNQDIQKMIDELENVTKNERI